jgi:fused signal recognition particle receptor
MGLFSKFKNIFKKEEKEEVEAFDKGLEKTRKEFVNKIGILNNKYKKVSDEYFDELEEILIMSDIGVNTVMNFIDEIKKRVKKENIESTEDLKEIIVDELFIIYVKDTNYENENFRNAFLLVVLYSFFVCTIRV